MTDALITTVAQEASQLLRHIDFEHDDHRIDLANDLADAVSAVATPIIEAQLYDRLIAAAETWQSVVTHYDDHDIRFTDGEPSGYLYRGTETDLADWLRARKEAGHD